MPSFSDSIFLAILALLLFGPKRLPKLAREMGKWVGEFRRASNEFKMQMEEELRVSEAAEREEKIAAIEAAAPTRPVMEPLPIPMEDSRENTIAEPAPSESVPAPLPIASSGDIHMMPPATGLPVSRSASYATPPASTDPLGGLLHNIPTVDDAAASTPEPAKEPANHA